MYVYLYMYIQIHIYIYINVVEYVGKCTRCLKKRYLHDLCPLCCHCRKRRIRQLFREEGDGCQVHAWSGWLPKSNQHAPWPKKKRRALEDEISQILRIFMFFFGGEVLVLGRVDISCRVGYCMSLKCNNFWDTRIHSDNHHARFVLRFSRKSLQFLSLMEVEKIQVVATQHLAIVCSRWLGLKAPHVHLEIWMVHVLEKETHVCSPFRWM